jgi:hypothetical protein
MKAVAKKLDGKAGELFDLIDRNGTIPATELFEFQQELNIITKDSYGKESGKYITGLKDVRHEIKEQLEKAAAGTKYVPIMKEMSRKLDALEDIKKIVGKTEGTAEMRSQSVISNINNLGKSKQLELMKKFEDVFGGDFASRAKMAQMAGQVGREGKGAALPRHTTGKAVLSAGPQILLGSPLLAGRVTMPITQGLEDITKALAKERKLPKLPTPKIGSEKGFVYVPSLPKPGPLPSAAHGNFIPAILAGANVMSKSPLTAKGLYGLGKVLKGKPPVPAPTRGGFDLGALGNERGSIGVAESLEEQALYNPLAKAKLLERSGDLNNIRKARDIYDRLGMMSEGDRLRLKLPETIRINRNLGEEGSIGGIPEIVGTPAIKDPISGKIYTGGWRGHKDALAKAEDETIRTRLSHEFFLDNTNTPTENVGFVDKKGNFISRAEAEKMLENKSKSLAAMFHDEGKTALKMLGASAAASGAGLTGYALYKSRQKK